MQLILLFAILSLYTALLACQGVQSSGQQPPSPGDDYPLTRNQLRLIKAINKHMDHADDLRVTASRADTAEEKQHYGDLAKGLEEAAYHRWTRLTDDAVQRSKTGSSRPQRRRPPPS